MLKLKDFEKIKTLGHGSHGQAFLVKYLKNNKYYCLKEVNLSNLTRKKKNLLMQEVPIIRQACKSSHPHICKLKASFIENENLCILLDYYQNGDLSQLLKNLKVENKPIQEEKIWDYFVQISLGLFHIHRQKIFHRDLKTENIFIDKHGFLRLGDFGISCILEEKESVVMTKVGTPYYLSPELCLGLPYGLKSDIFALGVILYQLCTLSQPFRGSNWYDVFNNIIHVNYPYIPISSNISRPLQNLIQILLQQDPITRPTIEQILYIPVVFSKLQIYINNRILILSSCLAKDVIFKEENNIQYQDIPSQKSPLSTITSIYTLVNEENSFKESKNEQNINHTTSCHDECFYFPKKVVDQLINLFSPYNVLWDFPTLSLNSYKYCSKNISVKLIGQELNCFNTAIAIGLWLFHRLGSTELNRLMKILASLYHNLHIHIEDSTTVPSIISKISKKVKSRSKELKIIIETLIGLKTSISKNWSYIGMLQQYMIARRIII